METKELNKWISNQRKKNLMKSTKTNISKVLSWKIDKKKIYHQSKSFFSIVPFMFTDNKKKWYQPLIIQKEIGILGILKKKQKTEDYYLLQAKVEPGNINGVQLSPTVQATKSNYLQKHGGKKTNYLSFFIKNKFYNKTISNLKLSEQGSRYLEKANKNILIDIKNKKIKKLKNYIWVTKKNLEYLLKKKNLLNMDTISVLSGSIKKNILDNPINKKSTLINNLDFFKKKYKIKKKIVAFNDLTSWKILKDKIFDTKKFFFSIFFLKIETNSREVNNWCQPIISDHFISFNGFLIKTKNKTNHYLFKIIQEPGLLLPKFTSTIAIKNYSPKFNKYNSEFLNFFKNKKNTIKFINSDEGGRFYKNETHNLIYVLKNNEKIKLSKKFMWVSHNQVIDLISKNLLTIEARNLFASFNIDKIH
jgi:oxidase EvaA